ncbi:MAG TPA: methyl-accepting chemotaxis protein [Methanomassiliicoccales archaeon]
MGSPLTLGNENAEDLIRNLPVPVIQLDPSFAIVLMNPAALKLVGKTEEQVMGRKCRDVMGPLCNKKDCMAERSLRKGETVTEEISFSLSGRDHTYKIVSVPLRTLVGNVQGVVEHFTDMNMEMEIVKDAMAIGNAAVRGDLSVRCDLNKYEGACKLVAKSFNTSMESVLKPLRMANEGFQKLAEGATPDMIVEEWDADLKKLKDSINMVRTTISARSRDIEMLINAADEGHLSVRADISKYVGYNGVQVGGINRMLDRMVHQMDFAIDSFDALAKGETPKRIEEVWKGDYERMRLAVNTVANNVSMRSKDIDMLINAVHEGDLSVRADASKYIGYNGKQIEGLNAILENMRRPLMESIRLAEAYGSGDLTARTELETKGDFHKLALALDNVGQNLMELVGDVRQAVEVVSATSQELASSAEEMNASTEQVASAIQHISKGAQNQSLQVDESARSMKMIAQSVEDAHKQTNMASGLAKGATDKAASGMVTVDGTVKKMEIIQKVVSESAGAIERLGKRSEEIGEIVDVITNISEQTNLLALNAAIEAARAGDQGRGFAVVAEEVKNLAEDSREAAERIAKMIREVQNDTSKAVEAMKRGTAETAEGMSQVGLTGKAFKEILEITKQFVGSMEELTKQMVSQSQDALSAAKAVDGISSISEETASASEESAASTQELTASMEDLTARAQSLSEMATNMERSISQFIIEEKTVARPAARPKASDRPRDQPAVKVPENVRKALDRKGVGAQKGRA